MTRVSIVVVLFVSLSTSKAQDWVITSVAAGTKPAVAVDSEGDPHVTYVFESPSGWLRYAVWNTVTMAFDTATVSSGNLDGPAAIGVDRNDVPHVVYHRHDQPPEQVHAYLSGPTWVNEDITDPNHDGWDNAIAFDSQNLPRTSSVDPSSYIGSTGVEYAWNDGVDWHVEQIGSALINFFSGTSIAIDSVDNPHITYYDNITQALMYAVKENGLWTFSPVETDGDAGRFSSLELNSEGFPIIGYYKHLSGTTGVVRLAEFDGVLWSLTTVDTLIEINLLIARSAVSLSLNAQDEPTIGYGDQKVVKYARRTGATWEREIVVDHSSGSTTLGHTTSLDLGILDQPHIVYYEVGGTGTVKHATRSVTSGVDDGLTDASGYALLQNYPNPFNPSTEIEFRVPSTAHVTLRVYDLLGREVATLRNELLPAGSYINHWNARGMPGGVYFYRLQAGTLSSTRKLVLLR
jgi:hypothetical protein